jgi:hypothetical protein
MKLAITTGFCPQEWKATRTILFYKEGERNHQGNWRQIPFIGVIYQIMFCRITKYFHEVYEKKRKNLCDIEQKGFAPNKSDLVEYTAITNAIINDVVGNESSYLYYHLTS